MTVVTFALTDQPSRSKMAGPCWITVNGQYAKMTATTISAQPGDHLTVEAKATLRRASGRSDTARRSWTVTVTGNTADVIDLWAGTPQSIDVRIVGVVASP